MFKSLTTVNIILVVSISILQEFVDEKSPCFPDAGDSCRTVRHSRFILYDVARHEGFNLRRDVYTRIARFVRDLNMNESEKFKYYLVLPPWDQLPHWRSNTSVAGSQSNLPWSLFFDLQSMKRYIPVLELFEFLEDYSTPALLDHVFQLQHFADLWVGNFSWTEKWAIEDCHKSPLYYPGESDTYRNKLHPQLLSTKSFHCMSFQGPASMIKQVLDSYHGIALKFENAEIILNDNYGDAEHWKCRESIQYSLHLIRIAFNFRKSLFNNTKSAENSQYFEGDPCLCVHLRRRDFVVNRRENIPSLDSAAKQIREKLTILKLETVFIATDSDNYELEYISTLLSPFKIVRYLPSAAVFAVYKDAGVAIIEQIICSYARYFIGSFESTFSFRIQEEREILNFHPDSTFNRLCGDIEKDCNQPTRWLKPRT